MDTQQSPLIREPSQDVEVVVAPVRSGDDIDHCLEAIRANCPAEISVWRGEDQDGAPTPTRPWIMVVHPDVLLAPASLRALVQHSKDAGNTPIRAQLVSTGVGDYWSDQLARAHNLGRMPRDARVGAWLMPTDAGEDIPPVREVRSTVVRHRCRAGGRNAAQHWLARGMQLGRFVRECGRSGLPVAGRGVVATGAHVLADWRHPRALPYSVAAALGTLAGVLRGLRGPAGPGLGGRALVATAFCVVLGLLFLLGAGLGAVTALVVATVAGADVAGSAAGLPPVVPIVAIAAVLLVELSRAANVRRGRTLAARLDALAVGLALVALTAAVLRLARLIGLL